jgi:hypothetical protein
VILEVAGRAFEGPQVSRDDAGAAPAAIDDDGGADQPAEQEADLPPAIAARHAAQVVRW